MDKKVIMAVIETAVDVLLKENEHLVADLDLRSTKDEQMIAEIHMKNGKPIFFHFYDRPEKERAEAIREQNMKMYRD